MKFTITAGLCALAFCSHAKSQVAYLDIPLLPGTVRGGAYGVNEAGDVVGWCADATGMHFGFLYRLDTGTFTNIGPLGTSAAGFLIGPQAINDNREVVGVWGCNCAGSVRSFYWSEDLGFTDISFQPRPQDVVNSGAYAINQNGQVAGFNTLLCLEIPFSVRAAALWTDPTDPQTPPLPVFPSPFACGIGGSGRGMNDLGAICGWVQIQEDGTSWIRATVNGIQLPTLSPPHGGHSDAFDVNNSGVVCGYSEDRSGNGPVSSPCFWSAGGQIVRLTGVPANSPFGRALAINDSGDIVGWTGPEAGSRATIWASLSSDPVDLNTMLANSPGAGQFLATAEDISNSGYIVGRLGFGTSTRPYLLIPCDRVRVADPQDTSTCPGGPAEFVVSAPGATGFRWQVNLGTPGSELWCDLFDGVGGGVCAQGQTQADFTGTDGPRLTISWMSAIDSRQYRCRVTTDCGEKLSEPAALWVCTVDVNCDGILDFFDVLSFLSALTDMDPGADLNSDGVFDFFDVIFFVAALDAGCP